MPEGESQINGKSSKISVRGLGRFMMIFATLTVTTLILTSTVAAAGPFSFGGFGNFGNNWFKGFNNWRNWFYNPINGHGHQPPFCPPSDYGYGCSSTTVSTTTSSYSTTTYRSTYTTTVHYYPPSTTYTTTIHYHPTTTYPTTTTIHYHPTSTTTTIKYNYFNFKGFHW